MEPSSHHALVAGLVSGAGEERLHWLHSLEEKLWLKEAAESLKAEDSGHEDADEKNERFLELKEYFVVSAGSGELASLLDVGRGLGEHLLYGRLHRTDLGADRKPVGLPGGGDGCLGVVGLRLEAWGIWWVDPQPILFSQLTDEDIGLEATLELHVPHPAARKAEPRTRHARLQRLIAITNIVLFEFAETSPKATMADEEARAAEDSDVITLSDGEGDGEGDEDPKPASLHSLLKERRGLSLAELRADKEACEFIRRQLQAEQRRVPLVRELVGLAKPTEVSEQPVQTAPPHDLVVTPRVGRTLGRCMMDLLGDEAYGKTLASPPLVAQAHNGTATSLEGLDKGKKTPMKRGATALHHAKVKLSYDNGATTTIRLGDFVRTQDCDALQFLKVLRMYRHENGDWKAHAVALRAADSTVLGAAGRPAEVLYTKHCTTVRMQYIEEVVAVKVLAPPDFHAWRAEGREQGPQEAEPAKTQSYSLRFRHTDAADDLSFAYLSDKERTELARRGAKTPMTCLVCEEAAAEAEEQTPKHDRESGAVQLCGEWIRPGQAFYLRPDALVLKWCVDRSNLEEREAVQKEVAGYVQDTERRWPEARHYQKQLEKGDFLRHFVEPFAVVRLARVLCDKEGRPLLLFLRPFYRTTDLHFENGQEAADAAGFPILYDAQEEHPLGVEVFPKFYMGRAYVTGAASDQDGLGWAAQGPNRFFCRQRYSLTPDGEASFEDLTEMELAKLSLQSSGSGADRAPEFPDPNPAQPLQSLEMFCGGGGSSTGLHSAGISTRVAVDMDLEAVQTLRKNRPDADVRQMDVNLFLQSSIEGRDGFPRTGDFDLIFGGPPCQGFSAMNRSPNTANSKKKNTCVTTQLGAYDFFRPAFVGLENVHGILNQKEDVFSGIDGKKSSVAVVIMAVMLDLGYQVRAYQLLAGAYGVPQTRNRVFICGAAPGQPLPALPMPSHASRLPPLIPAGLNGKASTAALAAKMHNGWSAPFPELTVADAISDLPETEDGVPLKRVPYGSRPRTWYQMQLRGEQREVTGHESRALSALDRLRVRHVPPSSQRLPEPDWRLIPNIQVDFNDDVLSPLPYEQEGPDPLVARYQCPTCPKDYHLKVKGRARPQWKCNLPVDTLVPAGLTHKSKSNSWKDCYGRVTNHLWFKTITTGDSLNQQAGRILHPSQHRILTTRELARAQGFPDGWAPEGRISARTRQIGNAVPPPLTRAIGHAIRQAADHAAKTQQPATVLIDSD